jgi:hypothetical protein
MRATRPTHAHARRTAVVPLARLSGFHAAQAGAYGGRGRAGFIVSFVGLAFMVAGNVAGFWLFTTQAYAEANGGLREGSSC